MKKLDYYGTELKIKLQKVEQITDELRKEQ